MYSIRYHPITEIPNNCNVFMSIVQVMFNIFLKINKDAMKQCRNLKNIEIKNPHQSPHL